MGKMGYAFSIWFAVRFVTLKASLREARNLGIDGFCTDCSGNYDATGDAINPAFGRTSCPNGMGQTGGDSLTPLSNIVDRVREQQP